MSDPAAFAAFGATMLVIALLCVAIDWFGKPLKHRKFVPKIYRFPEERQPRGSSIRPTEWSDAAFVLPVAPSGPPPVRATVAARQAPTIEPFDQDAADPVAPPMRPPLDVDDLPTAAVDLVEVGSDDDAAADEFQAPLPTRDRGWKPGGFVFNLTDDGAEPSPQLVRERYWRNVASTSGAGMFGDDNVERMTAGRPPRRRNPRTGAVESMTLPAAGFHDARGRTPVPSWPDDSVDPFAR